MHLSSDGINRKARVSTNAATIMFPW